MELLSIQDLLTTLPTLGAIGADEAHGGGGVADATAQFSRIFALIPFLPLLGCVLCGLCAAFKVKSKLPAWITVGLLALSFFLTVGLFQATGHTTGVIKAFDWINFDWAGDGQNVLVGNFSFYIDSLTCLWMLFVTGLATMIALYASEYMSHDVGTGYSRFFMAFCLFVFSMACLVMGDNLILLFLGWEGVGLCSYLLIGYFYKKPSAVAASKKAFIMNRIGDFGLSLGIMLTFVHFGTVEYAALFGSDGLLMSTYMPLVKGGDLSSIPLTAQWIPILLMIGAFGKSAQLPLYVWLPDAMEGPTPVSALIHAATMVTAGIYLIARMYPVFMLDEVALPIVAWVGALTALVAATIGMAQFDIKRIMAYSTVSQLGYMFAGLGVLTSAGAAFHVFTHAFFKATLFLCCGAVMHGFAGQLDLRKLSGVGFMPGWRIVGVAMFIGCLNLAGFPFTAGYFSKDMILAQAFETPGFAVLGWILLITAGMTAYYTFRVFFRVFVGPKAFEPGDELHDHDHGDSHEDGDGDHAHDFHPHPPGWAINTVLVVLMIASVLAALTYVVGHHGWVSDMVHHSSAHWDAHPETPGTLLGMDPHKVMYYVSGVIGLIGIGAAWWLHYAGRRDAATAHADDFVPVVGPIANWARGKWFVDELYDFLIVKPLWVLSHVFHMIDKLLVDGLVNGLGMLPRGIAMVAQRTQSGILHDYALRMLAGVGVILLVAMLMSL